MRSMFGADAADIARTDSGTMFAFMSWNADEIITGFRKQERDFSTLPVVKFETLYDHSFPTRLYIAP